MLRAVNQGPSIVACSTCRFSPDSRDDADGQRGGQRLYEILMQVKASDPRYAGISVQKMACLFACQDYCTAHIRDKDKISYILGRLSPDEEAARALLDYAVLHAASRDGRVPYSHWPEGVKGHFITRMPPAGFVEE
ncbi:MAG TPA: DUF1636 domain-containing protein [Sphingopyxis sp.]|nr:DUF1636 domain-containing protein [Sphingopyxis sp.]